MSEIIVVNITASKAERANVLECARRAWKARGSAQHALLSQADIVLAVSANRIEEVFRATNPQCDPVTDRYSWRLTPLLAKSSLRGQQLDPSGTFWKPGDRAAWKSMPEDEFNQILLRSRNNRISVFPHTLIMHPNGDVELSLAAGYRATIVSQGERPGAKQRIQEAVLRLATTSVLTTYQTLADMLEISSVQAVARSIVRNDAITAEAAARVVPWAYRTTNPDGWLIPAQEDSWTTMGDDHRSRAQIVHDAGLGTRLENGDVLVSPDQVVCDAASLRRNLL